MDFESVVPEKSPNDQRSYEAIILPNKLKLLLIHDPEIVKSACSISVGVGSLEDPDRSLGLAHFLEHMLFMGSSKFPEHNEYSSFISTNSGFDNAYTSDEETNYYFEIKNSAFPEAVDRITNFFTGALLNKDCIEKQRQAVHEEYVLWTNDDNCRKWQVLRKIGSPPYSKFTIGNQETLNHENIRNDLVGFYNQRYSSNIINAVLCSTMTIEDMKKDLIKYFDCIPNKDVARLKSLHQEPHFTKEQAGKLVRMQSIKDQSIMEFFFVIDEIRSLYKDHVSDYITHVVGHEGKNSLLSILKSMEYATQLSAYSHHLITQTLIGVEVKLTQTGSEEFEKVYNIVMDFMSNIKAEKPIYEEIREQKKISFQFKEKSKVSEYVCQLSSKMHDVPVQEILNFSTLFHEYDEGLLEKYLAQINPFNVVIVFSSSEELEDPITEKYLGAKYQVLTLPQRASSGIEFKSFPPNTFIPINTAIFQRPKELSSLVPVKPKDNIHFLHEDSFKVCKGGILLKIHSQEGHNFLEFYASYLELLLKEMMYPAEALNAKIDFESDDCLTISIFSFNDTVVKLIEKFSEEASTAHQSAAAETIFNICLNHIIEDYENFYCQQSDEIAETLMSIILEKGVPSVQQFLEDLNKYEYKEIAKRIDAFWKESNFEWITVGNFQNEQICQLASHFQSKMRKETPKFTRLTSGCLKINETIRYGVQLDSEDLSSSCCIVYYNLGPYSEKLYYMLSILKNHIDQPFFNELRTEKQMAYYLGTKIQNTRGTLGWEFILVSSTRDPFDISEQIKGFANKFFGDLSNNLNEEKMMKIKDSVATKITAPHNNLKSKYEFVAKEINENTNYFSRKQKEEVWKFLNDITLQELKELWDRIKGQTLDILIASKNHQEAYRAHKVQTLKLGEIRQKAEYFADKFI